MIADDDVILIRRATLHRIRLQRHPGIKTVISQLQIPFLTQIFNTCSMGLFPGELVAQGQTIQVDKFIFISKPILLE